MTTALESAKGLYMLGIRDGQPRKAVELYTGDRYTQHSTGVKDGADGFVEFFETFIEHNPKREIEIVRSFEDGDFVFMNAAQSLNGGRTRWVTMDILQADEQGRMIEHWDVIAEWIEDAQIEGPSEPTDLGSTAGNKAFVEHYVSDVLREGRVEGLASYVSPDLVHHDPSVEGIDGLSASVARTRYLDTVLVVGSGDMVVTLSRVDIDGAETAVMDLFRVADGRIAEQWNAKEPIPPADELVNSGKF